MTAKVAGATDELVELLCVAKDSDDIEEACDQIDAAVVASITEVDSGQFARTSTLTCSDGFHVSFPCPCPFRASVHPFKHPATSKLFVFRAICCVPQESTNFSVYLLRQCCCELWLWLGIA